MNTSERPTVLRSTRFQAPGEPLPLRRRLGIHNQVVRALRGYLQDHGFVEVPVPQLTAATGSSEVVDSAFSLDDFGNLAFPRQTGQLFLEELVAGGLDRVYCEGESLRREWKQDERHLTEFKLVEVEARDLDLADLVALQEALLKHVLLQLDADLVGGRHVTRLERVVCSEHPRLTYREALTALNRRGWSMPFGEDLHRDAEAALVRYCGNLPVHVTHWPEQLEFFNARLHPADPTVVESVDYVLPHAGETCGGSVREADASTLERRLHESAMYRHLRRRAREFAQIRAAARAPGGRHRDVDELIADSQAGIDEAFGAYLARFAPRPVPRAGFGLGVARLLQFVMGLDSIKDAVVYPLDRTSLGAAAGRGDALHSSAGIA
ncbi:MAG: amino acid--tRNA ligase-related protein [Candidatus Krumholzibacteriia bacterium]